MQQQQLPVRPFHPKQTAFEFTKRKRWADLLVTELTEAIILILDSNCHILFCGTAVNELLGWRDDEVIDVDFVELINADDKISFKNAFLESIRTRNDMLSYIRLIRKAEYSNNLNQVRPKEVLFEIQGYAHFLEGENECACFFAMAKPYPSRNIAMLNTFLELKMENEKLQQRVLELKTRNAVAASAMAGPSFEMLRYTSSSSSSGTVRPYIQTSQPSASTSELSGALYAIPLRPSTATFEDLLPGPATRSYESAGLLSTDDEGQSEPVKKKSKKVSSSDQYVCITCGRTDSPEWRKGPLGPKTLCNACGLRWAKKMRKTDDSNEGGGTGHSIGQSI